MTRSDNSVWGKQTGSGKTLETFMQRAWNRMDLAADLQRIWNL